MTRYLKHAVLGGPDSTERDAQLGLVALTGAMIVTRFALSAILKRKLDGASLTIFVKPAADGSQVTIMSEGLSWDQ